MKRCATFPSEADAAPPTAVSDPYAFTVVQPVLKEFHAPTGSYLIKRFGKPGAKQERIEIGDAGQNKITKLFRSNFRAV